MGKKTETRREMKLDTNSEMGNVKQSRFSGLVKTGLGSMIVLVITLLFATGVNAVLFILFGRNNDSIQCIAGLLEGVIAAFGTVLVVYQLKQNEKTERHQNSIDEATFILNYNQFFIQDRKMTNVEQMIERCTFKEYTRYDIICEKNSQDFVNYLVYLEGLASLILNGAIRLDVIDDLMAYRFFLAMDNAEIQKKELVEYAKYYRGCYKLYKVWKEYRDLRELGVPFSDEKSNKDVMNPLDECVKFRVFSQMSDEELKRYSETNGVSIIRKSPKKICNMRCVQLTNESVVTKRQYKAIARLIFDTDPFIYPALFGEGAGGRKRAVRLLPLVFKREKDSMFSKSNLFVLMTGKKVIGIILWYKETMKWNPQPLWDCASDKRIKLNSTNIKIVKKEYFDNLYANGDNHIAITSLVNLCIDKRYQGSGAGSFMIKEFLENHMNETVELAVLTRNTVATGLYKSFGFREINEIDGFSLDSKKPKCKIMRRKPVHNN